MPCRRPDQVHAVQGLRDYILVTLWMSYIHVLQQNLFSLTSPPLILATTHWLHNDECLLLVLLSVVEKIPYLVSVELATGINVCHS